MLSSIFTSCGVYLAAVADTALSPALAVYGVAPSFLIIVAVIFCVASPASLGRVAQSGAIGLVFDLNSGGHAGVGIVAFALLGLALTHWRAALRRLGIIELVFVTAAATAVLLLALWCGYRLFGAATAGAGAALPQIIGCALYTGLCSAPAWTVSAWWRDAQRGASTTFRVTSSVR